MITYVGGQLGDTRKTTVFNIGGPNRLALGGQMGDTWRMSMLKVWVTMEGVHVILWRTFISSFSMGKMHTSVRRTEELS